MWRIIPKLLLLLLLACPVWSLAKPVKTIQPKQSNELQISKKIDFAVNKALEDKRIEPSALCSDDVFLRRAYLALASRLPSIEECDKYLKTKKLDRSKLIDELVESEDFVNMLCLKWGDLLKIKSEFPSNIWPNGVQAYNRWVREHVQKNTPYDEFVRDLLVSTGSNFRTPQVGFYRAFVQRKSQLIADNVELLFLARRKAQNSAKYFFEQLRYKNTGEWKEEIVYVDLDLPLDRQTITMDDGVLIRLSEKEDRRKFYVDWLTARENKAFARAYVNRVWFWLFNQGIVNEVDDMRADNPPTNELLIEILSEAFIASGYDSRTLIKAIAKSQTFSRSALSTKQNKVAGGALFAYFPTTRMTAEQIIDGISQLTGINDRYVSRVPEPYSYFPAEMLSSHIGDATVSSPQLDLFGRPSRDNSLENGRSNAINGKQTLYLLNSSKIALKIERSEKIKKMIESCSSRSELIDKIYLMMLTRRATAQEQKLLSEKMSKYANNAEMAQTLIWALLNTSEFLYRH